MIEPTYEPFESLYPKSKEWEQPESGIQRSVDEYRGTCSICGRQTIFIEINFMAHYCSRACVTVEDIACGYACTGLLDASKAVRQHWKSILGRLHDATSDDNTRILFTLEVLHRFSRSVWEEVGTRDAMVQSY